MYKELIPAKNLPEQAEHLLLIHGWGISSQVWQPLTPLLSQTFNITLIDLPGFGKSEQGDYSLPVVLANLLEGMPQQFSVLGFSLGGMLAVQLAKQYPERINKVITIASNAVFVEKPDWPAAMAESVYQQFYQTAEQAPAVILKRFSALQAKGAYDEKGLVKQLRALADKNAPDVKTLLDSLNLLTELDSRTGLSENMLCLFGSDDQLVPLEAEKMMAELSVQTQVIAGASHVPHVSHADVCAKAIKDFLQGEVICPKKLNKIKVAESFAKAAKTYDSVAGLQRDVGEALLSYLPKASAETVVDLGCGTGFFLPRLKNFLAPKQLVAVDMAEGMLQFARGHREDANALYLCGDAEFLPLADNSIDLIFSSLAIQWCEDVEALFAEIFRVLKPGGRFVFSTLGPETLIELRQSWRAVDDYVHVNQFLAEHRLMAAIVSSGLEKSLWQQSTIVLQYQKLTELTRELKNLGAHNVNDGRPQGLMGKQKIKAFRNAYESHRDEQGNLPATYQVWYGVLEKGLANG